MKKLSFLAGVVSLFISSNAFSVNNIIFGCETKDGKSLTVKREGEYYTLRLNEKVLAKNKEKDILQNTEYGNVATLKISKKNIDIFNKKAGPHFDYFDGDNLVPYSSIIREEGFLSDLVSGVSDSNKLETFNRYTLSFSDSRSIYVLMAFAKDEVESTNGGKYIKVDFGFLAKTNDIFPQTGEEISFCKNSDNYAKIGFDLNKIPMNDAYKKYTKSKLRKVKISERF